MIDEQKLLHNLKKRNRNSLDDIIKIYTPYISVIVYNTVGCKLSKEDMEEIVSDTFFLLWQNFPFKISSGSCCFFPEWN